MPTAHICSGSISVSQGIVLISDNLFFCYASAMPKKILLVLAQNGYQDLEYEGTRDVLVQAGMDIVVASAAGGPCKGRFGGTVESSIPLATVRVEEYDVIVFIGGPGAEAYTRHPAALRIAHEAVRASIPLGAICIAPLILAKARVLDGKRATVWDSSSTGSGQAGGAQAAILEQYGATYTGDAVTRDGLIVTANGPDAAEEFGKTLLEVMSGG